MWRMSLALVLVAGLLGGCKGAGGGKIDGYWAVTEQNSSTSTLTLAFTPPERVMAVMTVEGKKLSFVGRYKIEGDTFWALMDKVDMDATDPKAGVFAQAPAAVKEEVLKDFNSDPEGKMKWEDSDKFTVTWKGSGRVSTFTRTVGPDLIKALHGPG